MKNPFKFFITKLGDLRNKALQAMLIASSSFFITLTILRIFFPSLLFREPMTIVIGWVLLLSVSSRGIPERIRSACTKIVNVAGSATFIVLFVASFISPTSVLGMTYYHYGKGMEYALNQFFVGIIFLT